MASTENTTTTDAGTVGTQLFKPEELPLEVITFEGDNGAHIETATQQPVCSLLGSMYSSRVVGDILVRSVNSHATLLSALSECEEALKEALPIIESLDTAKESGDDDMPLVVQLRSALIAAQAVRKEASNV